MRYFLVFLILFFLFQHRAWSQEKFNEFIIAKPHMSDLRFKESVILMFYHDKDGAAGLVLNKPIKKISINKLFEKNNLKFPDKISQKKITLYWGGPVNANQIFFIHSSEYKSKNFIFSNNEYTITKEANILFDIANDIGPKNYIILSGIAIWSSFQLDSEIQRGDWEKKTNSFIKIFYNGIDMWSRLINSKNI